MSPIFSLLLTLSIYQATVNAQGIHFKPKPEKLIKIQFQFSGELLCKTVENGAKYAFWVELWEHDGLFGTRVGDDHLPQVAKIDDTVYPNTYSILAHEQGDGFDLGKKYEPYIRVNHNCTSDHSVTITDFPVELTEGRFDIKATQYIHRQVLDLTPPAKRLRRRRYRRSTDRKEENFN